MTTYSRPGAVNASNMLLEINHVSVDYSASSGTVHALTDVSISLERGQILEGSPASQASTSTVTNTEPVDILQMTPAQLRAFRWSELSIVFQSAMNALNPVLNIGAQIMDVLQTHRPELWPDARRQRAIELLRLVGIA
ncbi:MAG: ABC transporter ATP-binding protein, partial [Chloroflexi bacterium]